MYQKLTSKTLNVKGRSGSVLSKNTSINRFPLFNQMDMKATSKTLFRLLMLLLLLTGLGLKASAQLGGEGEDLGGSFTISGPTSALLNQSKTYTITGTGISSVNWIVSKGTITSSNNSSATVIWNQIGTGNIYALVTDTSNETDPVEGVSVSITNPAPSAPPTAALSALNNCSTTTIYRSAPPVGVTWYWQGTSASGMSTANSASSYPVTTAGTYYLRARNSSNVWSTSSTGIYVTIDPSVGSVSITGGLSSRCEGSGTTDYNASATNATGYNWSISPSSAGSINSSGLVTWNSSFDGTATISVTATGCTPTNATKTVTVTPLVGAVSISGGVNSRCEGSGTTDYNASAANANSYSWSIAPSGAGSINSSGLVTWNSSFDGTATISVTASGTCGSTNTSKTVTTTPNVGSVSISGGVNSRCEGSGTTDYNASASNASSYSWSIAPSGAGSINSSGLVTWNSSFLGTATVSVTANGTCGSTNTSKAVVVNNNVGPVSIVGASSRCKGSGTLTFNASAIEATGYNWSISPSVAGSINSSGVVTWNSSFGGTATVSVTANGTCGSTSATKTVTTTPNVGSVSISGGVNSRCEGSGTTDYNASATNANSYSWSIAPSGAGSINSSGLVTWNSSFDGTATITVTASGTCGSTNTSKTVTTTPNVGSVSISGGVNSRCEGSGTTDYNASASNASSYSWSIAPSGAGSINSSGLVTWNSSFLGTATVSVTANGTCGSTNTSKAVVVNNNVGPVSIVGASSRCQGSGTLSYDASAIEATGYNWSISPSAAGSINSSGVVTWNSSFGGTATISVIANGTCGMSNSSKTVTVTPIVGPVAISGGINSRCEGAGTTDFDASASNASGYTWSIAPSGAGAINSAGLVTWNSSFDGAATISVTATGCAPTTTSRVVTVTPVVGSVSITGPDNKCEGGGTSVYSASATNAGSYSWSISPAVAGSINSSGLVTWNSNFDGAATISATANGCSPTSSSKVVNITSSVGPVTIVGPDSRCEGSGTGQYNATATDASSYSWTIFPAGAGSIDQNGLVTWNNSFDGMATLSATAHGSCGTSYISKFVAVTSKVEAVTILNDGLLNICQGTPTSDYNATALHASSYVWSITPSTAGTINTAGTVNWNSSFTGPATIAVTASGCGSVSTNASQVVNVLPQVGQVSLSGGLTNRWQGVGNTDFNATAVDVVGYIWSVTPVEAGSIDETGLIIWNSNFSGTATVSVIATGQCGSTNSTANIEVEASPLVGLSNQNDICKLGDKTFLTSLGVYDSYTWKKEGQTVGTGPSIEDKGVGNYTLVVAKAGVPGNGTSAVAVVTTNGGVDLGNHNYVTTTSVLIPGITNEADVEGLSSGERAVNVQYFDGLGRPVQTVGIESSPSRGHIVQPIEYDPFGRQVKQYLPFVTNNCNIYQPNPTGSSVVDYTSSPQYQFYQSATDIAHDTAPYAVSILENSPTSRVLKQGAPGAAWQPVAGSFADHVVRMTYEMNGANQVKFFTVVNNIPVSEGYYGERELISTVTGDEDGNETVQFTDKAGRVILKRVYTGDSGNPWAETQYVYDNFGNLSTVLPPEANKAISDNNLTDIPTGYTLVTSDLVITTANYTGGSYIYVDGVSVTVDPAVTLTTGAEIIKYGIDIDFLNTWVFQYKYDQRQRMVEKRVPGAGWMYMAYDDLGRLVLTQDANQRADNQWIFTKYDELNRPVLTGFYNHSGNLPTVQALVNAHSIKNEILGSTVLGYTNNAFPLAANPNDYLSATYYDDYANLPADFTFNYADKLGNGPNNTDVKGQVVGSKTKLLDGSNTWLKSTVYYDNRYRVIETLSDNHLGNKDLAASKYDFVGRVLETESIHKDVDPTTPSVKIIEKFTYDHASRLLEATHRVNSEPEIVLVKNKYNALGELIDKKLHSVDAGANFEQSVDYGYNIRGWLKRINDLKLNDGEGDYFGMVLVYEAAVSVGNTPAFNGNISVASWSNYSAGNEQRDLYNYEYDGLNRLVSAEYRQKRQGTSWVNKTDFDLPTISYDLNGNIQHLTRNHKLNTALDDLSYTYTGNQLLSVTDAGDVTEGFKDGNTVGDDYAYDANGNMTSDANKDITSISYNHLNLPDTVTLTNDRSIVYTYDAAGIKLKKQVSKQEQQTVTNYNIIETSDFSSGLDGWAAYQAAAQVNQNHAGETDVLKMTSSSTNNLHRLQKVVAFPAGEQIRIRAKIYLPSTNTNADGIQIQAGFSSAVRSQVYTTTDTWLSIDYTTASVPNAGFMFFLMKDGSSDTFLGTNNDYFFIKDIEVSNATGTTNQNVEVVTTTDYVGGFMYEDAVLQQLAHAEGRVRPKDNGSFVYDYYLKDHLGNTRITFTTENEQVVYLATMETDVTAEVDYGAYEESLFLNLPATRVDTPSIANSSGETGITNDESARLRGNDPARHIGPAKLMQVMRGDIVDLEVQAYYGSGYVDNGNIGSHILFPTIISMVSGAAPIGTEGANITNSVNGNSVSILVGGTNPTNAPRAYLNYIYFDADFNFIDAGFTQVGSVENAHQTLAKSKVISESGYLYVYVSNESNNSQDVFFDDLRITHTKGKVLQEDHYYPFGMNIQALSSTAPLSKPNDYKYNGFELESAFDLGWYDYQARQYDPQLGRFTSVDPAADLMRRHSPYNYAFDNPIRFIDPDGMMPEDKVEDQCPDGNCEKSGTFWGGWNKKINQFNKDFRRKIQERIEDPSILLDDLGNTADGILQTLSDVTGISNLVGNRNQTAEALEETVNTLADIPNMNREQLGETAAAASIFFIEAALEKKVPLPTSRAARRQAMRDQGIPTSQQPISQSRNASGREYTYSVPSEGGGTRLMSAQQQTLDRSHPGQGHWEVGPVKIDPITRETRWNNYGRPKLTNQKSKRDYDK